MCEQYRMSLMAMVDGELTGPEQAELEEHLSHCAYCNEEYLDIVRVNEATTEALALAAPGELLLENYYSGVCCKLESGASWVAWSVVSLMLVLAGMLMIFGCQGAPLAMLAGAISMSAGAGLVGISYFCNSCRK